MGSLRPPEGRAENLARPKGFEPLTYCSGGFAASRINDLAEVLPPPPMCAICAAGAGLHATMLKWWEQGRDGGRHKTGHSESGSRVTSRAARAILSCGPSFAPAYDSPSHVRAIRNNRPRPAIAPASGCSSAHADWATGPGPTSLQPST